MKTILLISPYWKEDHRWMVSSYKLADLWSRLGYRVVVAAMGSETKPLTKLRENLFLATRKDWFLKDPWNYGISFGFAGFVSRLAKEEQPDIVVVNKLLFWSSLASISLRLRGYRVLQLTDALVGMTWWPRGRIPKVCAAIYAWTIGWLLLGIAERVVFFHPQPPTILRKLGIEAKSMVIPTGIDSGPFHDAEILRAKETGINITYVGRLESVKGVDDFLAAAVMVKKEHPELNIQVAGWAKPNHPLVHQYQDDVSFLGLRSDVPTLLAGTHIFVLPSYSEGLSNALMEAMASGCACIASDVGGNRFLIQNGVSGFLFPAGDRSALASYIRKLVEDQSKRRSLGEKARQRIEETFSWKKVGEQYRLLFDTWTADR